MLIYNYKKEFLGIDETDLDTLGLTDLADLRAESADFADLFIKTPGCIHNFKHVHWIDYVLNKDGAEAKVIIHVKNKNYAAQLEITTVYLVDNPSKKAHAVNLKHVRLLSAAQSEKLSNDILNQAAPRSTTGNTELFTTPGSIVHDENSSNEEEFVEASYDPYESADLTAAIVADVYETPIQEEEIIEEVEPLDLPLGEDEVQEEEYVVNEPPETQTTVSEPAEEEGEFAGYIYNPQIASEELGLPIDLIEEFVEDFIAQAQSFKSELYKSAQENELDNLKIQSHKLKGVAANLRIENVLDALKIVNTSSDINEINTNLDRLFVMIAHLSGGHVVPVEEVVEETETEIEEDDMILSFKDEPKIIEVEIQDSDVPQSIDIAELADDEFLNTDTSAEEASAEDLSILDNTSSDDTQEEMQEKVLDMALAYDKKLIANDIGLDINSFNELFDDYIKESLKVTQTMSEAASNNDLSICKTMSIKLKGMSDNMRVHKFDDELHRIIGSTSGDDIIKSLDSIVLKLNQISNEEA